MMMQEWIMVWILKRLTQVNQTGSLTKPDWTTTMWMTVTIYKIDTAKIAVKRRPLHSGACVHQWCHSHQRQRHLLYFVSKSWTIRVNWKGCALPPMIMWSSSCHVCQPFVSVRQRWNVHTMWWGVWFGVSQTNGDLAAEKTNLGSAEVKGDEQATQQKCVWSCVQNERAVMLTFVTDSCILKGKQRKSLFPHLTH